MLNAIASEAIKIRKNGMALIGTVTICFITFFMIIKALYIDSELLPGEEWIRTVIALNSLVFPVAGGLVITGLVQKEYQDNTIRNILSAPLSAKTFVMGKLGIWFLWYATTLILSETIAVVGYKIVYPAEFAAVGPGHLIYTFTLSLIINFVACIPLLWVTIKQRSRFYPAILITILFLIIEIVALYVTESTLFIGCVCPWTAVTLMGMLGAITPAHPLFAVCVASITICGLAGVLLSLRSFSKQDH